MNDIIIVLGIAPCLEEDLFNITSSSIVSFDYMAIGVDCSDRVIFDIQHAASYHPDEFVEFKERRKAIGGNLNYKTHSHMHGEIREKDGSIKIVPVDYIWPLVAKHPFSGSSSFIGCQAALSFGYKKVVMCGCPMIGPSQSKKSQCYDVFQQGWVKFAPSMFGDRVKSMSGWTREFLGCPTEDWLQSL